ncbi:putative c6 zinc finger domain-containing protein [Diaporthe ampelina]|uniref:Putative c6 zinc finger domain-containing protein n=1 Tax=Diaporthe ampelina TaxID=1214573 RepID=A0A0G2FZU2_9PEZI|nr:putative c6 zinc finger domain-containing protein [Diaporthe ampelina]
MAERHSIEDSDPPVKRRKIRKGTKSCWECRKRKIKCQFDGPDDAVCVGCKQRETACRSQEFDDSNGPEPGQKAEPPLSKRLDRLEQMMERLVDKIVPDDVEDRGSSSSQRPHSRRSRTASADERHARAGRVSSPDGLEAANTRDGPIAALLAMQHDVNGASEPAPLATPVMTSVESATSTLAVVATPEEDGTEPPARSGRELPSPKHFWVCTTLRATIPKPRLLQAIVSASPAAPYIAALCHSDAERQEGKVEPASSWAVDPPVSTHPLILARKALQILICVQQLPPAFDWDALGTGFPQAEFIRRLDTTCMLVTSNDELVGYAEGVECLILHGYYQVNAGSLRKAWITFRRAINMAQIMGIDRGHSAAFRSCDPKRDPTRRPSAATLWHRLLFSDRYLSLLLGLPVCSQDDQSVYEEEGPRGTAVERLERAHTIYAAKILDRNHIQHRSKHCSKQQKTTPREYALTQEIDLDLEEAAKNMPFGWWDEPKLDPFASQEILWEATARIICQMHHFTLLILLHVPYMLHEPWSSRYDHSKSQCLTAARELLSRFISFRNLNVSAYSCRRVDYAALIAAMTLCLSYLGRRNGEIWDRTRSDRELVESTRRRMEHVAGLTYDSLGKEAVGIIERLAPIIEKAAGKLQTRDRKEMHFNVPYLGSINIKMAGSSSNNQASAWQNHQQPPAAELGPAGLPKTPAFGPLDPAFLFDDELLSLAPYDDQAPFGTGADLSAEPDLTADGGDWALQGVDAAYWSLFEGVM